MLSEEAPPPAPVGRGCGGATNIDKTAPTLEVSLPEPVLLNATVTPRATAGDGLSGVASVACGAVDTSSVGAKRVTCTATDNAGNATEVTTAYSVAYDFGGFRQPIPLPVSTFKAGSTIPVKFALMDANGVLVGTATAQVSAGSALGMARYDATAGQYIFNLQTKGMAAGPLAITVALDDGTAQSVVVNLG